VSTVAGKCPDLIKCSTKSPCINSETGFDAALAANSAAVLVSLVTITSTVTESPSIHVAADMTIPFKKTFLRKI
jgi:hypothetical protein